jgi:hypothetical protein
MNLYQHSGKFGYAPVLLPVAGIPLLLILALIYAYINVYNPIGGYLTFLIILGYAFACGFVVAALLKFSKCRNHTLCLIGAGAGAVLSLYFAWAFFLYALAHRFGFMEVGLLDMLLNPFAVWGIANEINATGWFSIKGATPSGIFLWVLWSIEAVTILVVVALVGSAAIDGEMFCERCNAWCDVSETKHLKMPEQLAAAKPGDINALALRNLEAAENGTTRPAIQAELINCQTCRSYAGWRYKLVSTEIDKDGNEKDKLDDIPGIAMA